MSVERCATLVGLDSVRDGDWRSVAVDGRPPDCKRTNHM